MSYRVEWIREYWDGLCMWKEWMSTVWPEECLMAEVSGGWVWGRPRLGWMDGVIVALNNRGSMVEAARQYAKDRREWRALVHMQFIEFHLAIFAWPCVFSDHSPVLWWLSPGEGWDAVSWCMVRTYETKIKAHMSSIWAKGFMLDDCVCYLTWHDYHSLVRENVFVYYLFIIITKYDYVILRFSTNCTSFLSLFVFICDGSFI